MVTKMQCNYFWRRNLSSHSKGLMFIIERKYNLENNVVRIQEYGDGAVLHIVPKHFEHTASRAAVVCFESTEEYEYHLS
jgi:hypothetical protein